MLRIKTCRKNGVSLKLSQTEIHINESEKWELLCIGDGNPLPELACLYGHNSTTVGEQYDNVTFINVEHANCVDTGLYICSGNNTIGESVSESADIKVSCKPRTYANVKDEYIFINGTDESLNISTKFISFPLSQISWKRELLDGNLTDINKDFKPSTHESHLPYETLSFLQKFDLKEDEYGIYVVNASNIHGSFVLKYHVIVKRAPDPPTNITASCGVTSIGVTWISRFNGGENQTFRINFQNNKTNEIITKAKIFDQGRNKTIYEEQLSLSPDTLYWISLAASNVIGTAISTEITSCTTDTRELLC
ncbi:Hypothetical predicted protein [Mytilus galloprovincialis]|uniref:Fibronectin type-III domain-containing protein n=1 Tax=Mytilus galloprovincialis TaxID=29158 RepID=A0A8B6CAV7_MYTGA|nr:Hypothetical predicted protein [Mytilus galloprovincialis]